MAKKGEGNKPRIERKAFLQDVYYYASLGTKDPEIKRMLSIDDNSWANWLEKGNKDKEDGKNTPYSRFVRMLNRARASRTVNALVDLDKESKAGQWQASKILLEQNQDYNTSGTSAGAGINIQINDMRQVIALYGLSTVREAIERNDMQALLQLVASSKQT